MIAWSAPSPSRPAPSARRYAALGLDRSASLSLPMVESPPVSGADPPAAVFFLSPIGRACIPGSISPANSGIPQADAYAGFNTVYRPDRKPGVITEAGCWAHARRKLFELADIVSKARKGKPTTISPIAFEAVRKMDAIFMLDRSINGLSPEERLAARRRDIVPLVDDLIDCRFEIHLDLTQARIECDRVRF